MSAFIKLINSTNTSKKFLGAADAEDWRNGILCSKSIEMEYHDV